MKEVKLPKEAEEAAQELHQLAMSNNAQDSDGLLSPLLRRDRVSLT